jgi:hypothetical protein
MATTPFDAHQAIEVASSSTLPPDWHKYPTHRGLVLTRTITTGSGALLTLALVGLFIVYGRYVTSQIYEVITLILFVGLAAWLVFICIQGILILRDINRHFFLITPTGLAQVKGSKVIGFSLTELTKVQLVRDLYGVSLLLTLRSGGIVRISGLRAYGQPTEIGRQLIAACSALYPASDKSSTPAERSSSNNGRSKNA